MCSDKQRLSNQSNAQNSTGPKTVDGKSKSARNSLKHGLTAKSVLVLDEKARDFEEFADEMRRDLLPSGALERSLIDRIILLNWKLSRVTAAEQVVYKNWSWKTLNQVTEEKTGWEIPVKSKVGDVLANEMNEPSSQLVRLQTYEVRIERQLHSCLRQLAAMRKMAREESNVQNEPSCETVESTESSSESSDEPLSRSAGGGGEGVLLQSKISDLKSNTTPSQPPTEYREKSEENEPSLIGECEGFDEDAETSSRLNGEKETTA